MLIELSLERVQNGSLVMASAWDGRYVCLALFFPGPESTRDYSHHARYGFGDDVEQSDHLFHDEACLLLLPPQALVLGRFSSNRTVEAFIPYDAWRKIRVAEESERMALDLVGSVLAGEDAADALNAYVAAASSTASASANSTVCREVLPLGCGQ